MLTDTHRLRAENLHLYGLLAHWTEIEDSTWVAQLLDWEEAERARRSLERRLSSAHIGRFKPLADFDWNWPEHCDRLAITELMSLEFLKTATNAILVGAVDWENLPLLKILRIRLFSMGIPFYLPAQGNCSATLPHWIATRHYDGVCVITQPPHCW